MKKSLKMLPAGILTFVMMASFLATPLSASAISMSPPGLTVPSVLRGASSQTGNIRIGRLPSEVGDLYIEVSARGEGSSSILFEPSFVIPADAPSVVFPFQIDGSHIADGTYNVLLTFLLMAPPGDPSAGTSVAIITGATFVLNFTVSGEEVFGYTLNSMSVSDAESDSHPFVRFNFTNTGNVDWKPEKAVLSFIDVADPTHIVEFTLAGELFSTVSPGKDLEQIVEIPQFLPEGSYTLSVNFFHKGDVVGELIAEKFMVFAPGSLKQSGDLLSVSVKKNTFVLGEKIPLEGQFKNTGEVPVSVVLMTEIYLDDAYVDVVRSEETVLSIGETTGISQRIDVKSKGKYTLTSFAKFSNKKSPAINTEITVTSGSAVLDFVNSPVGLGSIVLLIALVLGAVVMKRRKARVIVSPPVVPAPVAVNTPLPPVEDHGVPASSSGEEHRT